MASPNRSEAFGRLLKAGIASIANLEGKTAPVVEEELGAHIGVAGKSIQRYKAGYVPPEARTVEILAEACVRQGWMGREWLEAFLFHSRYPGADKLLNQLRPLALNTSQEATRTPPSPHEQSTPTTASAKEQDLARDSADTSSWDSYPSEAPAKSLNQRGATVLQALEERYQPPERALRIEVYRDEVLLRYEKGTYRGPNRIDDFTLNSAALSPRRYGEQLFAGIFHNEPLLGKRNPTLEGYDRAWSDAEGLLCLQIALDHTAPYLQAYRWEQLCDPRRPEDPPIAAIERMPFYRRVESDEALPAEIAVDAQPLKILVAVCAPLGLGQPGNPNRILANLSPIDVAVQTKILDEALGRLKVAGVADYHILGQLEDRPAKLGELREALEAGYHVLHLLAHGVIIQDDYYVVMDNDSAHPFVTTDMLSRMLALQGVRLAVLASCQSGVLISTSPEVPSSFAATLVRRGVPAVVAMQDLVTINTVQFFTHHFYDNLARSGRVDMALSATRAALHQWVGDEQPDWGIPTLSMSGEDGRLFVVDEVGARARLKQEMPRISSPEQVSVDTDATDQILRLLTHHVSGISSAQLEILRSTLSSGAKPGGRPTLAREQNRDRLNTLCRPMRIVASELRAFVEGPQGSGLQLPLSLYQQIAAALNIGKHIILIGPPGTGKTSLAHDICHYVSHPDRCFTQGSVMTTASADWTTFDTVGGYVPSPQGLQFRPGIFLRAICDGHWLVIDEINRAEIDKAFGELFTILSSQIVDLPYWVGEHQVRVLPALPEHDQSRLWVPPTVCGPYDYVVHPNWRIIGAMNVYDKSSLFTMSFAFMRRFAFIDLDVPAPIMYEQCLLPAWLDRSPLPQDSQSHLGHLIRSLLSARLLMRRRALGPAIIKDLVRHICETFDSANPDGLSSLMAEAITLYAIPQLDALDHESICAIYAELLEILPPSPSVDSMLARIRLLYPHISDEIWPL